MPKFNVQVVEEVHARIFMEGVEAATAKEAEELAIELWVNCGKDAPEYQDMYEDVMERFADSEETKETE